MDVCPGAGFSDLGPLPLIAMNGAQLFKVQGDSSGLMNGPPFLGIKLVNN
jgi:hypothetical protein